MPVIPEFDDMLKGLPPEERDLRWHRRAEKKRLKRKFKRMKKEISYAAFTQIKPDFRPKKVSFWQRLIKFFKKIYARWT